MLSRSSRERRSGDRRDREGTLIPSERSDAQEALGRVLEGRPISLPLHWEEHGTGGPPVLLLHGFGTNGYTWNRWLPELTRRHRVYVVDMKGFGASPKPRDGRYSPQDQAALAHHLILERDLRDLTLIGHSLGGGVALLAALRLVRDRVQRLAHLVLVAGTAVPQPLPRYLRLVSIPWLGPAVLRLLPTQPIVRKALHLAYFDPGRVTEASVEAYAEPLRTPGGRYALSMTARQMLSPELDRLVARFREITTPTLLLWGQYDPVVPRWVAERAAELLPHAAFELLPDCGHMPQEEKPEESLEMVMTFLRGG